MNVNYLQIHEIFKDLIDNDHSFQIIKDADTDEIAINYCGVNDMRVSVNGLQDLYEKLYCETLFREKELGIEPPKKYYLDQYFDLFKQDLQLKTTAIGKIIHDAMLFMQFNVNDFTEIATPREIMRIEQGIYPPPTYLIIEMSKKLGLDLQDCITNLADSQTLRAYQIKIKFDNEMMKSKLDFSRLLALKKDMEAMWEFKNGENLQYLYYLNAILSAVKDNDLDASNDFCIRGIRASMPDYTITKQIRGVNRVCLVLLNCLGSNYIRLNKYDIAIHIFQAMLNCVENKNTGIGYTPMYPYTNFEIKLYPNVAYNISTIYYRQKDYDNALIYVDKGLEFSRQQHNNLYYPVLLQQKFCILCRLGRCKEADKIYQFCHLLAEDMGDFHRIETLEEDKKELFNM